VPPSGEVRADSGSGADAAEEVDGADQACGVERFVAESAQLQRGISFSIRRLISSTSASTGAVSPRMVFMCSGKACLAERQAWLHSAASTGHCLKSWRFGRTGGNSLRIVRVAAGLE